LVFKTDIIGGGGDGGLFGHIYSLQATPTEIYLNLLSKTESSAFEDSFSQAVTKLTTMLSLVPPMLHISYNPADYKGSSVQLPSSIFRISQSANCREL
jgi:hypothetical protein